MLNLTFCMTVLYVSSAGFLAMKQVAVRNIAEANDALREAKTLQSLSHRNVVRYHDVFLHADGGLMQICTVMEFCRSGDLVAYLTQLKAGNESLDEKQCLSWMFQLCDALCYVHSEKIVHRDLKVLRLLALLVQRYKY